MIKDLSPLYRCFQARVGALVREPAPLAMEEANHQEREPVRFILLHRIGRGGGGANVSGCEVGGGGGRLGV